MTKSLRDNKGRFRKCRIKQAKNAIRDFCDKHEKIIDILVVLATIVIIISVAITGLIWLFGEKTIPTEICHDSPAYRIIWTDDGSYGGTEEFTRTWCYTDYQKERYTVPEAIWQYFEGLTWCANLFAGWVIEHKVI